MFSFPQFDPETTGQVNQVPVPIGSYLGAMFDQGQNDSAYNSIMRMREISLDDSDTSSPMLDTQTANQKYGVGDLKFDEPVRESVAATMNARKRAEMDRQFFLANGSSLGRFVPGMAASMLGGVSNPLDLGLMFVPFVGEEAAAEKIAAAGGGVVRQALARGLISREALAAHGAPRLLGPIIQGAMGQSLFEIPNLAASLQDKADYGVSDAARNIATGGILAGGIHLATDVLGRLSRGTREAMMNQAVNDFLRDKDIRVQDYVNLDEAAIRDRVAFNPEVFQAEAQKYAEAQFPGFQEKLQREGEGQIVAAAMKNDETGKVETAPIHSLIDYEALDPIKDGNNLIPGFITDSGRFIPREEAEKFSGTKEPSSEEWKFGAAGLAEVRGLGDDLQGDTLKNLQRSVPTLQQAREAFFERPEIKSKLDQARQQAIQDFIEKKRAEYDPNKAYDAEVQKEIAQQQSAGRIMTKEQIQKYVPPEKFDETAVTQIDKDVKTLEQNLKQGLTDEEKEAAQRELDEALGEVGEPQESAIQTAVDCIIKKIA